MCCILKMKKVCYYKLVDVLYLMESISLGSQPPSQWWSRHRVLHSTHLRKMLASQPNEYRDSRYLVPLTYLKLQQFNISPKERKHGFPISRIRRGEVRSVPSMMGDASRNQISDRVHAKCHGWQRTVASDAKARPFQNFSQIVRSRHVVKQAAKRYRSLDWTQCSEAAQGGIGTQIDRRACGKEGDAGKKLRVHVPLMWE